MRAARARTGPDGELIPLAEQDRALWDRAAIAEGVGADQRRAVARARSGPTSCRRRSPRCTTRRARAEDTDWPQILALYGLLGAHVRQPDGGAQPRRSPRRWSTGRRPASQLLDALDADGRLAGHHRLDAVRAHLLEMAGDRAAAIAHYRAAAGTTTSVPERNYLLTQAARLATATA